MANPPFGTTCTDLLKWVEGRNNDPDFIVPHPDAGTDDGRSAPSSPRVSISGALFLVNKPSKMAIPAGFRITDVHNGSVHLLARPGPTKAMALIIENDLVRGNRRPSAQYILQHWHCYLFG